MRILLVEDDHPLARTMLEMLRADQNTVDWLDDGQQALNALTNEHFDLVILDLTLPRVDGLDIVRRSREQGSRTPIIILTARSELDEKLQGLDAGADDYLTKPFAFDELVARIQALLRRNKGAKGYKEQVAELVAAGLTLNRETREVYREGRQIELTPKEYALLEYFMQSPGRVFSRSQILDQVWGYNADPLTNVVEVYIRNLRRKLDEGFSSSLIKTVRGFGYKLELKRNE